MGTEKTLKNKQANNRKSNAEVKMEMSLQGPKGKEIKWGYLQVYSGCEGKNMDQGLRRKHEARPQKTALDRQGKVEQ